MALDVGIQPVHIPLDTDVRVCEVVRGLHRADLDDTDLVLPIDMGANPLPVYVLPLYRGVTYEAGDGDHFGTIGSPRKTGYRRCTNVPTVVDSTLRLPLFGVWLIPSVRHERIVDCFSYLLGV